jgi:ketosteroid isomerase-like protein
MGQGAHSPEELETLLEDAFVTRDADALSAMFAEGAVLVTGRGTPEARGANAIATLATSVWERGECYVAEPRRVVQARDTALVVGAQGISVLRRERDGAWRYAIALLSLEDTTPREEDE